MKLLQDMKILDFTTLLPGPYATLMLADMGADVLKISSPKRKDFVLEYEPFIEGTQLSANEAWLGRNKRNIYLDLKNKQAVELVKELIKEYDIIIEQFRPGIMDRLGLGYEQLKKVNPKIIYCSLTGYGQTGPMANAAGHDCNYMARSGNLAMAGYKESGPAPMNIQIADLCAGAMNSVVSILAAVHYRTMTGIGQAIDVAMLDGLIPFLGMEGTRYLASGQDSGREQCRLNGGSVYGYYRTKDDEFISVGSLEPKFWRAFCLGIDCPDLIEGGCEPDDIEAVRKRIRERFLSKTKKEWIEIFKELDCCVEPVLSVKEALDQDPQIQAREMVCRLKVPSLDPQSPQTIRQLGFPVKFSKTPVTYDTCGYPLGYHTREVIEEFGFDYESLKEQGVFGL